MKVLYRVIVIAIICLVMLVGGGILWFYTGFGLPEVSSLEKYRAPENSKILAADGSLLTEVHGEQNREAITLEEIPAALQKAVIATEDDKFYEHEGVDWEAILRALWANIVHGSVVQGGSTITQQYVKNAYVGTEKTVWRKVQEAYLAYQLEKKYSKKKILEFYLNDVYFGQGCYGIYTAARRYFGKLPQQLTLSECALLTGLIRSPSYYDPYKRPAEAVGRRNLVLSVMYNKGYINSLEMAAARSEPLNLVPPGTNFVPRRAPYFCDYVISSLCKKYGDKTVFQGGLRIYTTLDPNLQETAEEVIANEMNPNKGPDAALCCIDPKTGFVKAMVGGKNYLANQFNVAASGRRQPGSAFKVFVLTRAIADGISPEEKYDSSSPKTIILPDGQKWKVHNYSSSGGGKMSIREATVHSVNVVFAQLIMDVEASRVAEMAKVMGITSTVESNPAIALGGLEKGVTPLEMASAYGTLANGGVHTVPRSVYKVTDSRGEVLDEYKPETNRVLDRMVAAKVNEILQEVVSRGTGTAAKIGRPQAGKTGTTQDHADAWFVGYTPDLVASVWVGYPQGRISLGKMSGGSLPATIWREFMAKALENTPPTPFETPKQVSSTMPEIPEEEKKEEVVTLRVCDESGLLATNNCPHTHLEEFKPGTQPRSFCTLHGENASAKVPYLIGKSADEASRELENMGFEGRVVKQYSTEEKGKVISQTPAPGTTYKIGNSVTIVVSLGPPSGGLPRH